jgi:hypothetical protein
MCLFVPVIVQVSYSKSLAMAFFGSGFNNDIRNWLQILSRQQPLCQQPPVQVDQKSQQQQKS